MHKIDRLARSRADDVTINLAIQQSGARLVSVTENIDETPSGMLLHGIMSSIAEFYSRNLGAEVLKGTTQKAQGGGTPGRAPVGYRNVIRLEHGSEYRTVELDPERAPLMRYAFEAYATGDWSTERLLRKLTEQGLTTAPTKTRPGQALVKSHFIRLLKHPYYRGIVRYRGVEYPGRHQALVDEVTWQTVQNVLAAQNYAGEKRRIHDHYLKGSVFCKQCGSRLVITHAVNRHGTTYPYFVCSGRKRLEACTQRAILIDQVEELVERHYATVQFTEVVRKQIRARVAVDLTERNKDLVSQQALFARRRQSPDR